jgi:broad-specificity NMP kinase
VILCESVEIHNEENIFEIDTTEESIEFVASSIIEIIKNKFQPMKKYNIGKIDWSEEILKDF